jgi:hypothetical protein
MNEEVDRKRRKGALKPDFSEVGVDSRNAAVVRAFETAFKADVRT